VIWSVRIREKINKKSCDKVNKCKCVNMENKYGKCCRSENLWIVVGRINNDKNKNVVW
jgi:hypothetical protein